MFWNFRKLARIAAITMAASAGWSALLRLSMVFVLPPTASLSMLGIAASTVLVSLPLIALLLLLSATGVTVLLSTSQQYVVRALVTIRSGSAVMACLRWWRQDLSRRAGHLVADGGNFGFWLVQSRVRFLISGGLELIEAVAFILFLVALSRQRLVANASEEHQSQSLGLRRVALFAAIANGVLVFGLTVYPYFALRAAVGTVEPRMLRGILLNVLFALPPCVLPWVICQSRRKRDCLN